MAKQKHQIFISYSGHDEFEAGLLQFAIENTLESDRFYHLCKKCHKFSTI